jgi:hypothetical protein
MDPVSDDRSVPFSSSVEKSLRAEMVGLLKGSPIPSTELCENLALYMRRQTLMDVLALDAAYKRILTVPGIIIEAGTKWGRKTATLMSLRGIYEPYNLFRRIVAFDTFAGFPEVSPEDGHAPVVRPGALSTTEGYRAHLEHVLSVHEQESPIGHVRRFEVHEGDIAQTLPRYMAAHPEAVVALAYFDLDLYKPTRAALEAIAPRLVSGSVLAFDEINHPEFPGETRALTEVLGLQRYRAELLPGHPYPTIFTVTG